MHLLTPMLPTQTLLYDFSSIYSEFTSLAKLGTFGRIAGHSGARLEYETATKRQPLKVPVHRLNLRVIVHGTQN